MPKEWEIKSTRIKGASKAFYWNNKLHVFNSDGLRRTTNFPLKHDGILRVMVLGDSLTYGYGVSKEDTYTSIIQRELKNNYKVEILNLGRCGFQSSDILKITNKYLTVLNPDLVIYGVCQNDFLPSEVGQYKGNQYALPLPESFKNYIIDNTYLGKFFSRKYDEVLRKFHLRHDFHDDILNNFENYRTRFGNDVKKMGEIIKQHTGHSPIAMVLDQYPALNSRGHKITLIAEHLLEKAGFDVISTKEYYMQNNNRVMAVSKWEGHPNEEAHNIFAKLIISKIEKHPLLKSYINK
ncbi:MAG: hypothetical protein KAJ10_16115 [Thermodesulfovibrionia bacterium]|nr:hypothetical protein [Thermodesulfovibrionia bacterium]